LYDKRVDEVYSVYCPASRGYCSSCHGPKGAGIPNQYPRLAGQYTEYTSSTLLSYKNGSRANNKQMMTISKRMSDEQINAVSEYLAGLR
jgi:cytochrome c553